MKASCNRLQFTTTPSAFQGPTLHHESQVGRKTTYRILNNAESRVYAKRGYRGRHRESVPVVRALGPIVGLHYL
eukprot:scaffold144586_cov36-Prasinocladus_malaysianus.AAC.1